MATGACTLVCVPECLQGRQLPSRSYCKRTESLRNACWGPRGQMYLYLYLYGDRPGVVRGRAFYVETACTGYGSQGGRPPPAIDCHVPRRAATRRDAPRRAAVCRGVLQSGPCRHSELRSYLSGPSYPKYPLVHFRENSELLRGKGQSIAGGGRPPCEPYPLFGSPVEAGLPGLSLVNQTIPT